jgi:hypothetical protein
MLIMNHPDGQTILHDIGKPSPIARIYLFIMDTMTALKVCFIGASDL